MTGTKSKKAQKANLAGDRVFPGIGHLLKENSFRLILPYQGSVGGLPMGDVREGKTIRPEVFGRFEALVRNLAGRESVVVLFSGGVDSTLLAHAAYTALKDRSVALTFRSPLEDPGEVRMAEAAALCIGIRHVTVGSLDLSVPEIAANRPDRCYVCRKHRDALALEWARRNGYEVLVDGFSLSDLEEDRPGKKASDEDGVGHPLLEALLGRNDIRELSRFLGLEGWERTGSPCLATRFPPFTALSEEALRRVARSETALRALGFAPVRVRSLPGPFAVVETGDPSGLVARRDRVVRILKEEGFMRVLIDLEGYERGKMGRIPPGKA
jgi:uncharacterized protein